MLWAQILSAFLFVFFSCCHLLIAMAKEDETAYRVAAGTGCLVVIVLGGILSWLAGTYDHFLPHP